MRIRLIPFLLATACVAPAQQERSIQITWAEPTLKVNAIVNYPAPINGKGLWPAVVIVSDRFAGMNDPLLKSLANRATQAGFVAVRFDYGYQAEKGQPSRDQLDEAAQLRAVLDHATLISGVDKKKIQIAGKGLGSVIAYRVFRERNSIVAALLLNPMIKSVDSGNRMYPGLPASFRPVTLIVGNKDTYAPIGSVYNYLKGASARVATVVVAGDHRFDVRPSLRKIDEPSSHKAKAAVLEMSIYWLRQVLANPIPY